MYQTNIRKRELRLQETWERTLIAVYVIEHREHARVEVLALNVPEQVEAQLARSAPHAEGLRLCRHFGDGNQFRMSWNKNQSKGLTQPELPWQAREEGDKR